MMLRRVSPFGAESFATTRTSPIFRAPMAVMRAARGTETVVMLAISFNGDRGDSQSCDP